MRCFLASSRRVVSTFIALLLTLQSAGSALATTPQDVSLHITPLSVEIASEVQALRATHIGAILSGDGARWAAMHAPAPVFKHERPPQLVPPDRHFHDSRQFRTGVFRAGPHMMTRPLDINEAPKDPRAMRRGAPIGTPCTSSSRLCTTPLVFPSAGTPTTSVTPTGQTRLFRVSAGVQTMSITPTVQPFLFEADTTTAPNTLFVTGGHESGALSSTMDPTPPHALANETLTYTPYTGAMSFGWISPANVPNSISWPAQTYTVTLNVTQPNANLKITEITLYRVDANGGPGTAGISHVADKAGLSQSLGAAGTLTFTLSGTAQTASATDRFGVKFIVSYSGTTAQSFSYSAGQNSGSGLNLSNAGTLSASTTGKNRWWAYETGMLPGHGKYMVNVGNGNLLVQSTDVDIPERGIDLMFERTYNSESMHDSNNTDASVPSDYGDGWTANVDAHLAYHGANTISVYDIDGARYDYTADGSGGWSPPAGQHAILKWDSACGYQWTKKSGTVYYFYSPDLNESPTCSEFSPTASYPQDSAYGGRLYQIWARNHNNYIKFAYAWANNDATNPSNLSEIDATHADGHVLVLKFGPGVAGGATELLSITRPDGQIINYLYDPGAPTNLQQVHLPGNGSVSTITESYEYNVGSHEMEAAASPRYNASNTDGNVTYFNYDGSNRISKIYDWGLVNFTPADSTGLALQPGSTSLQTWRTVNYSGYGSGTTSMTDSDGHATDWFVDTSGRVTQTQEYTGETSPLPTYLVTTKVWDANNNLLETKDARGNPTDYAYDSNGNVTAVALPSVTTGQGTFRPTALYSYDVVGNLNYNNVTAYCDPVSNHPSRDWNPTTTPTPTPATCPTASPATHYQWDHSDSAGEPYGRLIDTYTPLGYHSHVTYDSTKQNNLDAGLPTTVQGDAITPQNDGTSRTPTQSFTYDQYGNMLTYTKGMGNWSLSYDTTNNRLTSASDPSGATSYNYYYNDGSLSMTETPYEHATGTGTRINYDADGDTIQENVSHGGTYNTGANPTLNGAATTSRYYDGEDRLVEVVQAQDSSDIYTKPWITRYIYDLSQNGAYARLTYQGQSLMGYGNLIKTQEFLPPGQTLTTHYTSMTPTQFEDLKGQSFDALDRVVSKLQSVNTGGTSDVVNKDSNVYDTSGNYGLLASSCNALNVCTSNAYDSLAETTQATFSDSTPTKSFTFDADGRLASVANTYATQTFTYDADGRETQSVESLGMIGTTPLTSAATLTYHYYADGKRSGIDVAASGFNQASLFLYAYRLDGLLSWLQINDAANSKVGSTTLSTQYDNLGRLTHRTESGTGANTTPIVITYNAYGMATQKSYPGGTLQGIEYDASGAPLGYQSVVPGASSNPTYVNTYTTRGELRSGGGTSATFANGVAVSAASNAALYYQTWDPLMGIMVSSGNLPPGTGTTGTQLENDSYFSAAGRISSNGTNDYDNNASVGWGSIASRQYDAENHVVQEQYTGDPSEYKSITYGASAYAWAANGRAVAIGSGYSTSTASPAIKYDTLHWDHDQLLFTSNAQGQVDDIKIGDIGDITPSGGLIFYDRAFGNEVSFCHSAAGIGGDGSTTPYSRSNVRFPGAKNPCGLLAGAPSAGLWSAGPPDGNALNGGVGNGGIVVMSRSDGISDGYNTIQGTRSFDSSIGSWTAPDWNSGQTDSPTSQKGYLWNDNDPITASDPSGFNPYGGEEDLFDLGRQYRAFQIQQDENAVRISTYHVSQCLDTSSWDDSEKNAAEWSDTASGTTIGVIAGVSLKKLPVVGSLAALGIGSGIGWLSRYAGACTAEVAYRFFGHETTERPEWVKNVGYAIDAIDLTHGLIEGATPTSGEFESLPTIVHVFSKPRSAIEKAMWNAMHEGYPSTEDFDNMNDAVNGHANPGVAM